MLCEDAQKKLPDFLNDMLMEENRREVRDHLSVCDACQEQVLRFSSFASDFKRLALHSKLPFDLASALMIRLKIEDRQEVSRDWRGFILVVGVTALIVHFMTHEYHIKTPALKLPKVAPLKQTHDRQLETLQELEAIHANLKRISSESSHVASDDPAHKKPDSGGMDVLLHPFHWHILAENAEALSFVTDQIRKIGADILYESKDLWVVKAQLPELDEVVDTIETSSGIKAEGALTRSDELPATAMPLRISLFFAIPGVKSETHHWHLKFELKNAYIFQNGMKDLGLPFLYESDELWIVELDAAQFNLLKQELQAFPGLQWSSKSIPELLSTSRGASKIRVAMYIENL